MAKSKKAKEEIGGPFLAAAVYCHTIISDPEGQVTPAGIFDTINLVVPAHSPPSFPSEEQRVQLPVWSFISFRTGDAPGDHKFYLVVESPSGKKLKHEEKTITLSEGPQGGFNLNLKITFGIFKGRVFWTNVYLDDRLITRMPLLINVTREGEANTAAATTGAVEKGEKGKTKPK